MESDVPQGKGKSTTVQLLIQNSRSSSNTRAGSPHVPEHLFCSLVTTLEVPWRWLRIPGPVRVAPHLEESQASQSPPQRRPQPKRRFTDLSHIPERELLRAHDWLQKASFPLFKPPCVDGWHPTLQRADARCPSNQEFFSRPRKCNTGVVWC
ncbi:uncharacterized protein LY89DRAFT_438028 [Mollisia scopiformis]|uniref:Uncharacterized protein n=1 Tax=Mollisia scopiformis TaxID=149040 RepID=A0A194XJE7_MOLSC|nr:uncharacterized protein LY89DRAFT_438028 [Mollisia scopiformis]KUJ20249.1 hypothetical protein LY89DRAFT_438028 [Mollisia scopiformis]